MRRQFRGRSDAFVASSQGEQGFWPSYADMMSAVALILFFLMLLSYIQNLITGNDLQNTQELLADTQASLSLTLSQVEQAESELKKITVDLDEAKLTLDRQKAELSGQKRLLSEQTALIGRQEEYMKAASQELLAMRSQMQTIAVLRLSILEQIRDAMAKVMGDASKVSIGESGNIVLSESILFDVGSSEIKPQAQPALDQLVTVFQRFLADDENAKYVDSIVISGHTDSTGTDVENRVLSTARANAVLNYLLSSQSGKLGPHAAYFCSAGYSENRPVADNDSEAGRAANRRIEISIILRDDSIMEIVDSYLKIDLPESLAVPSPSPSPGPDE